MRKALFLKPTKDEEKSHLDTHLSGCIFSIQRPLFNFKTLEVKILSEPPNRPSALSMPLDINNESHDSLTVLLNMEEITGEIASCTQKARLMTEDLHNDYLARTNLTGTEMLNFRPKAAIRANIAFDELCNAENLIFKLDNIVQAWIEREHKTHYV